MVVGKKLGLRSALFPDGLDGLLRSSTVVFEYLLWMLERRRQRRALAQLEDRLLDDIGLTRDEVEHEIRRSIWK